MMKKETLNTLILRHGDRMLRQAGWPDTVDMAPVAPETVPGWLAACGSLSGVEILTLTEQLCQPLTYGRAALLLASARRLAGTPARLHLFPVQAYPHPERLADCQVIRLPYAQEWLTAAECDDLLAFLKASLTQISEIVHRDTKRIAAALTPSVNPRLMDRRIGDWRLLAVEYDHDNGTVAKLAMRQPFVLFKGLTFQKLCLPGAFRPGDHHNKMLRPGLCVVHASPQYL